jgi:multidrug efflux pump subunit AcrB
MKNQIEVNSNQVQSKVLSRLQQQLSFVSAYKNMDSQTSQVEREIE